MKVRILRPGELLWAVVFLGPGTAHLVAGRDRSLGVLWILMALRFAWGSTRERPQQAEGAIGPGPLAPTPTGRFRATGWPPSHEPDDYR